MAAVIQSVQALNSSGTSVSVTIGGVQAGSTLVTLASSESIGGGVTPTSTGPSALTWTTDVSSGWNGVTGLSHSTPTVAGTYTVTHTAAGTVPLQLVVVEARLAANQLDLAGPGANSGSVNSTTATSPAITTTNATDLIVAAVLADGSTTLTGASGYTVLHKNEVQTGAGGGAVGALQVREVTATGSQEAPFTLGTAQTWGHMMAAYRVENAPTSSAALAPGAFVVAAQAVRTGAAYASVVLADAPVGYWRLDEPSGATVARDTSGNVRDGTIVNTVTTGGAGIAPATGSAYSFNGAGGYVTTPWVAAFQTSTYAIEAWFKPTDNTYRSLVNMPGYVYEFAIGMVTAGTVQFNTASGGSVVSPAGSIVAGNTYHAVVTYDGTTLRLYLNGSQVASQATTTAQLTGTAAPVNIGRYQPASTTAFYSGVIDEVALYDHNLTAPRVTAHYQAGYAASATMATTLLPFALAAQASGSTVAIGTGTLGLAAFVGRSYGPNVPQTGYLDLLPAPFTLAAQGAFEIYYTGAGSPTLAAFVAAASGAVVSRNATATTALALGSLGVAASGTFVSIRATGTVTLALLAFGDAGTATFTSKSIGTLAYALPIFTLATVARHPRVPDATMPITYAVDVGWNRLTTGGFILDRSFLNGLDLISGSGTGIDTLPEVEEVRIERGRQDATGPIQAGVCTIIVKDTNGTYNPLNASGPLYGQITPMRRVHVSARWDGVTYPLFTGYLRRLTDNPDYGQQRATLIAEDMMLWLSRLSPTIAATGATTTGNAIAAILEASGFTDLTLRRLDAGDTIPDFSADGTKTALGLIGDLLTAERGVFYVTPAGVARFESRGYRTTYVRSTPQGTIFGSMEYLNIGVDLDQIKNRATVTRTPPAPATAGVAQIASDAESQKQYGIGDWGSISSPYIASDAQALSLATYLVAQQKKPQSPIGRLEINATESNAYYTFITRDILDRLLVYAPFGVAGDFHIERVEHNIVGGEPARGVWVLTQRGDAAALANY